MADEAVKNEPTVEGQTTEDADRQVSETVEPIVADETAQPEIDSSGKTVKTPVEEGKEVSSADVEAKMSEEQRRAFQEQRHKIKELERQVASKQRAQAALDALKPPTGGQVMPSKPRPENFVGDDGLIDFVGYENAVSGWNEHQAFRTKAQQEDMRFEMERKFLSIRDPRVDPSAGEDKFDPAFERRVADRYSRLAMEALYNGLPEPTLVDAYEQVSKEVDAPIKSSKETLERVSEKEQASSISTGVTSGRTRTVGALSNLDELRRKTREGDDRALAARIEMAEGTKR